MPVKVRKSAGDSKIKGPHFDIIEVKTGKVKGHSTTREKAQSSANARNAALHGNWKPTGKPRRK